MPFKGKYYTTRKNAGKLWAKGSKGQGFGSLYGGNQTSDVTKSLENKSISEDRQSDWV
jgi:hypothetical protein